jgi:hypothetical protein
VTAVRGRGAGGDFRIFVSYRRDDAAGHAGRLHDALLEHFGREQIFMDIDAIEPGLDFVETIERALSQCDVLLVLIGPRWLGRHGPGAGSRLDDEADFVRLEVQAALSRQDLRVIPVLIQGAQMPASADLPAALQPLVRRNAMEVSDTRWQYDISQLIELLKRIERGRRDVTPVAAAVQPGAGLRAITTTPVRARLGSRTGVVAGFAAIAVVAAVLLGVLGLRPSSGGVATASGAVASISGPSPSIVPGSAATSPQVSAVPSVIAGPSVLGPSAPPAAGAAIATFTGTDRATTGPFTVDESWSLEWTSEAYFSLFVSVAENRSVFNLDGLRSDGSAGLTPMYAPGTFYLTVYATGPWTATIREMSDWSRTTLPYSVTGEASRNTPVFAQSGTTRVCWQSDGDSTFMVDLWSVSRRGSESAQSAVIETGATEGCADLEARSAEAYLEIFAKSGTWTVTAQTR